MIDNYDILDAYDSLESIKTHTNDNIDGEVLYAALSLITWAGMEKKEVVSAKIQDIVYDGDNIVGINLNSDNEADLIRLFGHPKRVFTQYLQYLNNNTNYDTNPDSPLFPVYEGESGKQNLYRHMKSLGETYRRWCHQHDWELGPLKEIGRFDYYLKKKESEGSEDIALQETVTQFRISERHIEDCFDEIKQKTRDKYLQFYHHLDQMTVLNYSNEVEIEKYEKEGFRLINKLTRVSEKKLRMKHDFQSDLSKARDDFFRKQSEKTEPTQRLSLQEAIRRFLDESTSTENSSPPNFDLDKRLSKEHRKDNDDQEKSDEDDQEISDKN